MLDTVKFYGQYTEDFYRVRMRELSNLLCGSMAWLQAESHSSLDGSDLSSAQMKLTGVAFISPWERLIVLAYRRSSWRVRNSALSTLSRLIIFMLPSFYLKERELQSDLVFTWISQRSTKTLSSWLHRTRYQQLRLRGRMRTSTRTSGNHCAAVSTSQGWLSPTGHTRNFLIPTSN